MRQGPVQDPLKSRNVHTGGGSEKAGRGEEGDAYPQVLKMESTEESVEDLKPK